MLSLDAAHPALVGRSGDALLDAFVFSARGSIVDCVWRAGKKLVEGGRHRQGEAVLARFRAVMARLLA
jgi:formimidoylglutamate deiminase